MPYFLLFSPFLFRPRVRMSETDRDRRQLAMVVVAVAVAHTEREEHRLEASYSGAASTRGEEALMRRENEKERLTQEKDPVQSQTVLN